MAEDEDLWVEEEDGDHDWHFRYNRRLSCFSHAVSNIGFSPDGRYLVSGTGSGDVKVWDTGCWAEAGKLRGCRREEPCALVISPAQRWLVVAYPSILHIFNFSPPWRLEQSLPPLLDPHTKEPSEWSAVAFSPMAEVDHPRGHAGQDNNLAAFSTAHLVVLDYSGGWGDAPRRTRSLMQSGRAKVLVYTSCGTWMVCGFLNGQLQVWNHASLTMVKTLSGHADQVNDLVASPYGAPYQSRIVSCGIDQTLRVWHSGGWILEQHVHETRCDRNGVMRCTFSTFGNWLMSVANELCIWRVSITCRGRFILSLHQRLANVCGSEGLRTAAFGVSDAIAVGSRDGVLGLWVKHPGAPPNDPAAAEDSSPPASPTRANTGPSGFAETRPMRPMQRVTQGGGGLPSPLSGKPQLARQSLSRGEWFQRAHLRSVGMNDAQAMRTPLGLSPAASATGKLVCNSPPGSAQGKPPSPLPDLKAFMGAPTAPLQRTATLPDLNRLRAQSGGGGREMGLQTVALNQRTVDVEAFGAVVTQSRDTHKAANANTWASPTHGRRPLNGPSGVAAAAAAAAGGEQLPEEASTPMRKSMQHACRRGLVQRITLDAKVITDLEGGGGAVATPTGV